jgi:hypothetical protein
MWLLQQRDVQLMAKRADRVIHLCEAAIVDDYHLESIARVVLIHEGA